MTTTEIIDAYCNVWSEPDSRKRSKLLRSVFADHGAYSDPCVSLAGLSALLDHIGQFRARRPGGVVLRTTAVDQHHNLCRFGWSVVDAAGQRQLQGIDVITFDNQKIVQVAGFLGDLQPIAD